jgi:hypothetical protein
MKTIFLETRNVARFREALSVLEDTDRGQPGLGIAWGQAGRGKTFCAREYAVRTGAVYMRYLQDWTPRAMLAELCRQLNGSEPHTVDRAKKIAVELLDKKRQTVLVDEADRLDAGLVEHLRDVHDLVGVPVVLIGEEGLFSKINAHRRIWSRVTQTVEFGPITTEDISLFGIEAAGLRLDPEAAQKIGARSGGDFRLVWTDMHALEQMARAAGARQVDAKMVAALASRQGRDAGLSRAARDRRPEGGGANGNA